MTLTAKHPRAFDRESKQLLDFARHYLSQAFPNPDRQGCPSDGALQSFALNAIGREAEISEHLAACSPCFRRYSELLAQLRSARARETGWLGRRCYTWSKLHPLLASAIVLCGVLMVIFATLLNERMKTTIQGPLEVHQNPSLSPPWNPAVVYSAFTIDLTKASPIRGNEARAIRMRRLSVPRSPLDLTLLLPIGSEPQIYKVELKTGGGHISWSRSAQARLVNGQIIIRMEVDFSAVPAGSYSFDVTSATGMNLTRSVLLRTLPPKPTGQDDDR
jgi:hypothetical protein